MAGRKAGAAVGVAFSQVLKGVYRKSMVNFVLPKKQPPSRSRLKRNLYQLLIARSDIHAALEACKLFAELVKKLGDDLHYPLFAAIVVCYARPFTANDPFGPLPEKWARFANAKHHDVHNRLMAARHEMIAHSDIKVREAKIIPTGYSAGTWKGKEFKNERVGAQTDYYLYPVDFVPLVRETAIDLYRRVNEEIEKLVDELYGGMDLPARPFPIKFDEGL